MMASENYSYPLDPNWTTQELETVIRMFNVVEDVYEKGALREQVLETYRAFKKVIPAKSEEKQLGRQFYEKSGYQLYDVVKEASNSTRKTIKLARR